MKKRKLASDTVLDGSGEGAPYHTEAVGGAPADGEETSRAEQQPLSEAPPTNGEALVPLRHPDSIEADHEPAPKLAAEAPDPFEERIRRLEEALAQLHELKEQQAREAAAKPAASPPLALVAPVARIVTTPAPIMTAPHESAHSFLFNVGKQFLAPPASSAPPVYRAPESSFAAGLRWTGLLFDAFIELRVIFRMYVDPRYHMPWTSRVVPIVLGILLLTSKFWAPGTSLDYVGWFIDKVVDLPLAFLLFKVLGHEARRYRQTSPDLPDAMRLPPDC